MSDRVSEDGINKAKYSFRKLEFESACLRGCFWKVRISFQTRLISARGAEEEEKAEAAVAVPAYAHPRVLAGSRTRVHSQG